MKSAKKTPKEKKSTPKRRNTSPQSDFGYGDAYTPGGDDFVESKSSFMFVVRPIRFMILMVNVISLFAAPLQLLFVERT